MSTSSPKLRESDAEQCCLFDSKKHSEPLDVSFDLPRASGIRSRETADHATKSGSHREQAELLAHVETVGGLGTWEIDLASRNLRLSDNLCKLLGYAPGTQLTDDEYWTMVHPADREEARQIATLAIHAGAPYEYMARIYATDRSVHWHFVSGVPLSGGNGKPQRIMGVHRDVTDEARVECELRRLSQQLIHSRDDERRRVARDLHESVGQTLAAMKMNLARLEEELPPDRQKCRELLRASRELADDATREVRTISYLMHPPMLDETGLNSALRWFARGFTERSKIRVDLEISEDFGRQSQEMETTIFRVVQEALTNVHRYSGSRTASIRVKRERETICVEVQDSGCGIQPAEPSGREPVLPGVGIAGMRERIQELEGTFHIESAPGRGTTIRTILPILAGNGAAFREIARRKIQKPA